MNTKRKFLAVSVKHSEYKWKFGMPLILWGWKRTEDHELRCFSNYTQFLQKAELYSIEEFKKTLW